MYNPNTTKILPTVNIFFTTNGKIGVVQNSNFSNYQDSLKADIQIAISREN